MDIASDDAGHIAAVWNKFLGMGNHRAQISLRSPGGGFTPALSFSDASQFGTDPAVGIAGDGVATVVWRRRPARRSSSRSRASTARGGRAGDQTLSTAGENPRIAVAPNGVAVATWVEGNAVNAAVARQRRRRLHRPRRDLRSPGAIDIDHAVAIDADGDAVAAWVRDGDVETNRRPRGGTFLGVQPIPGGGTANSLELAMAPNGRATAIWALAARPLGGPHVRAHRLARLRQRQLEPRRPRLAGRSPRDLAVRGRRRRQHRDRRMARDRRGQRGRAGRRAALGRELPRLPPAVELDLGRLLRAGRRGARRRGRRDLGRPERRAVGDPGDAPRARPRRRVRRRVRRRARVAADGRSDARASSTPSSPSTARATRPPPGAASGRTRA